MAQLEGRRSEAQAHAEKARAETHGRHLSLLAKASSLLLSARSPKDTLRDLFALLTQEFCLDVGFHYRCREGSFGLVAAAGLTPEQERSVVRREFGHKVCAIVAQQRKAMHVIGIQESDEELFKPLKQLGLESYFSAPLLAGGELLGTISFGRKEKPFTADEIGTLSTLVGQLATALERQDAEAELRASEERLRELNETLEQRIAARTAERDRTWRNAHDLLGIANFDGFFVNVNPAWERVLGWSEAEIQRTLFLDLVHPDDRDSTVAELGRLAEGVTMLRFENRYQRKDGSYCWLSWRAVPEEGLVYCVARDVTAEKEAAEALDKAQEQLRQGQKMEAVGQLTGGLAHDFNNLLAGISGSLELLQTRMAQGRMNDLERYITAAQGASKRAAALTHRLLAFTRRQTLDPKPTDMNKLMAGMEELVRRTVGPAVDVEVVGTAGLWTTLVDPNQLENALLNLCINARDAMPDGGRLTIETANKWLDERTAQSRDLPAGQYVSLCVSDTGTGMTPEVARRAFEPFFTTKPIGMGTGLGLSMIYGFVQQSGGQARIHSEPGQGTTVRLYLPRHHGKAEAEDEPAGQAAVPRAEQGETVLVVDDEPTVRMLVTEVLEDLGYTAIEAADGPAGLQVLRSNTRIDLLVTDVGLPGGMNGRQVADAGRAVRPELKVLFITGYAENAVLSHGHLDPGMHVLTKPFAMEALASRIKELIASKVEPGR